MKFKLSPSGTGVLKVNLVKYLKMAATTTEKQINNYLGQLSDRQKKAVLTVVKTFAENQTNEKDIWDDKDFIAEIERRTEELESGKVKGYGWEEVKQRARKAVKVKTQK